jgi:hypothetical protein
VRTRILLLCLLLSLPALGQFAPVVVTTGVAVTNVGGPIQNNMGQALAGVTIAIVTANPGASPSTPITTNLTAVYTDSGVGTSCSGTLQVWATFPASAAKCSNPGLSDGYGNWTAYVFPGTYWAVVYGSGIQTRVFAFTAGGSSSGPSGSGTVTSVSIDLTGISELLSGSVSNPTITPAITLSKTPVNAHLWYGNPTGSTTQPGFTGITAADLPFTYSTTNSATKLMTAGTTAGGTGALLCNDANHNATDSGCSAASGGNTLLSPGAGVNQAIVQPANTNLSVNRFETIKFAADLGLQAAITDCANNSGGNCLVILPAGTTSACNVTLGAHIAIRGMGRAMSTVSCNTNNVPVLHVTGSCSSSSISDLTVIHTGTIPVSGGDGIVWDGGCDRGTISNVKASDNYIGLNVGWNTHGDIDQVIAENNVSHGVQFTPDLTHKTSQWKVSRTLSEQNGGDGFHMALDNTFTSWQGTCPDFNSSETFGNNGYGFRIDATGSTSSGFGDCFMHGVEASQNNNSGFFFNLGTSGGRNLIVDGIYSEQAGFAASTMPSYGYQGNCNGAIPCPGNPSNVGYGIEIAATCDASPGPVISNGILWQNSFSGGISACKATQWNNISTYTNGQAAGGLSYQKAGISLRGNNQTVTAGYHGHGSSELYGVEISNGADFPAVIGTQFDTSLTNSIKFSTTPSHGIRRDVTEQTKRVSGCTTPNTQFGTCDSVVTWPLPFADSSYTVVCTGEGISFVAVLQGVVSKNSASATVRTFKGDAGGTTAGFTTINCTATHDQP